MPRGRTNQRAGPLILYQGAERLVFADEFFEPREWLCP